MRLPTLTATGLGSTDRSFAARMASTCREPLFSTESELFGLSRRTRPVLLSFLWALMPVQHIPRSEVTMSKAKRYKAGRRQGCRGCERTKFPDGHIGGGCPSDHHPYIQVKSLSLNRRRYHGSHKGKSRSKPGPEPIHDNDSSVARRLIAPRRWHQS